MQYIDQLIAMGALLASVSAFAGIEDHVRQNKLERFEVFYTKVEEGKTERA